MSSPLPCDEKRRFPDEQSARKRLTAIRHHPDRTLQVPRYAFRCPHCDGWHLSSNPDRKTLSAVLDVLGLKE